jgi:hypothetical protein
MIVRSRFHRLAVSALTAVICAAFVPLLTTPQAHAVSCYGDYCSGQDPSQSGCGADAYIAVSNNFDLGSLQIRYSPTCKTNWAKLVIYATPHCVLPGGLDAVQDTGYKQSTETRLVCGTGSETTFWTPMIYSPVHKVKAQYQSDGTFTGVVETAWA